MLAGVAIAASATSYALYTRFAWPWLILGWIGLVPWLAALDRARSLRSALVSGLLMAAVLQLAMLGWFAEGIAEYTGAPWVLAMLILAGGAPLLQPQIVTFAVARHLARAAAPDARWPAAFVGAGIYVGTEWALPKLFADTIGYGLYPSALLRQAAEVVGASGLTCALLLGNECVLALWLAARAGAPPGAVRRMLPPAACLTAILAALLGYGAVRTRALAAAATTRGSGLSVGVVQANLSHYDDMRAAVGSYEAVRRILDTHFALSSALLRREHPDLLVWPETVYPTTFGSPKSEDGRALDGEIASFVAAGGVPLIFGSYDREGAAEFNAAIVLESRRGGDGALAFDTYRKAVPFPLTERVPALLDSELVRGWFPWLGTWTAGAGAKVVPLNLADGRTVRVAPLICYDALAPGLARDAVRAGADLLVTLSNDSWFAAGKGPWQHLVGAIFRSIETRRPQARATNTGISALITATGDIVAMTGVDERTTLAATLVPDGATTTIQVAWGDWFGPAALVGALALLAQAARRRRP